MPSLAPGEIHVWRLELSGPFPKEHEEVLAADELERAQRFVFARDRDRFMHGRHALREILAAYLDLPPRLLPLLYNPNGKPYLDVAFELGFNLSHSGDAGLLAVGRSAEIGVDIEEVVPRGDLEDL